MLVLSRRKDETIMIGDDVEITIVDIKGDTVRLGIAAPKSVSVHRKEIYEAIQAENIAAARADAVGGVTAVDGLAALLKQPPGSTAGAGVLVGAGAGAPTAPASGLAGLGALLSGRVGPPSSPSQSSPTSPASALSALSVLSSPACAPSGAELSTPPSPPSAASTPSTPSTSAAPAARPRPKLRKRPPSGK